MRIMTSFLIVFFATIVLVQGVFALDSKFVASNLYENYTGTFKWHDSKVIQKVSVSIIKVSIDSRGDIIAIGKGFYFVMDEITNIDIKWRINPETMRFEMWESNPSGSESFVTDGSHVGTISNDLKSIKAIWTTSSTGRKGDLLLKSK